MDNKIQTGLRIPQEQYERLREMSDRIGVSINSLILMLIDLGIKVLENNQNQ